MDNNHRWYKHRYGELYVIQTPQVGIASHYVVISTVVTIHISPPPIIIIRLQDGRIGGIRLVAVAMYCIGYNTSVLDKVMNNIDLIVVKS